LAAKRIFFAAFSEGKGNICDLLYLNLLSRKEIVFALVEFVKNLLATRFFSLSIHFKFTNSFI
jgi:hypothetical protein